MSYDLMVFDPQNAPTEKKLFLKWFDSQTEWTEDHGYDDPDVIISEDLRNWFLEIIEFYPPLDGPYAPTDQEIEAEGLDKTTLTDYSIGYEVVYAGFGWSLSDDAYKHAKKLAQKYQLGFFDPESQELMF